MDRTEQSLLETATRFLELRTPSSPRVGECGRELGSRSLCRAEPAQQDSLTSAEPCGLGLPRYGGKQRRSSVPLPAGVTLRRVSG